MRLLPQLALSDSSYALTYAMINRENKMLLTWHHNNTIITGSTIFKIIMDTTLL